MSKQVELMVVRKDQLDALINAAGNVLHCRQEGEVESIVQDEFLSNLKVSVDSLELRGALESIRHASASGNDADEPVLVIVPPGMQEQEAQTGFDAAVQRAAALSADGEGKSYFEALSESLASYGMAIVQEIQNLEAGPWDQSRNPAEPDDVGDDDPEWVRVRLSGSGFIDSDNEPDMELLDGAPVDFKAGADLSFLGFVESLTYKFPRGEKYGIPREATDAGARVFVVDEMGFACSRNFDVMGVDTGDDSVSSFVAECVMPRDILVPVDRPSDHMTE